MTLIGSKCINPGADKDAGGLQASVTIEAALALPIFIFGVLAFAFWIMVLRTQEMVQCSLINAADMMAIQNYTISDIENINYGTFGGNMNDFYNSLEKYNMNVLNNSYDDFRNYIDPSIKKVEPVNIENYISDAGHMRDTFYGNNSGDPMHGSNGLALFKQYLMSELYKRASALSYNSDPSIDRKSIVNGLLGSYSINGGFDSIEFINADGVNDFNADKDNGEFITIEVKYIINVPFPIQPLTKIPIAQCVRVRVWGTGDD